MSDVLLVPLVYFTLETIEGQFITPLLTGRSLTLSPVMIFVSMLLWGWIWGVIGALMAVPILMTLKIFCDHIDSLSTVGEFVSGKAVVD
jgi:predicted PurR-regulated permease PerM